MALKAEEIEAAKLTELYAKFTAKKVLFILIGLALLATLALVAISQGAASLGVGEVSRAIVARVFPFTEVESTRLADIIVWQLRLPRVAMAIVAGCGSLALAILARYNKLVASPSPTGSDEVDPAKIEKMTVVCPRCELRQTVAIGGAQCSKCSLEIHIRVQAAQAVTAETSPV